MMLLSGLVSSSAFVSSSTLPAIAPFSPIGTQLSFEYLIQVPSYITSDDSLLAHTHSLLSPRFIYTTNDSHLLVTKIGTITSSLLSISSVLFVPNLFVNVFWWTICSRWLCDYLLLIKFLCVGSINWKADWDLAWIKQTVLSWFPSFISSIYYCCCTLVATHQLSSFHLWYSRLEHLSSTSTINFLWYFGTFNFEHLSNR